MCGGASANSLYRVYRGTTTDIHVLHVHYCTCLKTLADDRYLGCYFEDSANPDMTELQWPVSERKSARECIEQCSRKGFNFAGKKDAHRKIKFNNHEILQHTCTCTCTVCTRSHDAGLNVVAGVINGGQCSCGNSYGAHGLADTDWCMTPCVGGYISENCGGNITNAMYRVVRGLNATAA